MSPNQNNEMRPQAQLQEPTAAHLSRSSQEIVSEQPVSFFPYEIIEAISVLTTHLYHFQTSSKHSMDAQRQAMTTEPKLSLRGGGVVGDW
jgi:hypothetical protein